MAFRPESPLFLDDIEFIYDLLESNWSIPYKVPTFERETDVESFMMDARLGSVFVYSTGRTNKISTVDYRTLERVSNISIRVTTRFWNVMSLWGQEIYRILYSHRRMGYDRTNGYGYFEVLSDTLDRDLSGWYVTTFNIRMTAYAHPLFTDGFGHDEEAVETFEQYSLVPGYLLGNPTEVEDYPGGGHAEMRVTEEGTYIYMAEKGLVYLWYGESRTTIEIVDSTKAATWSELSGAEWSQLSSMSWYNVRSP